MVYSSINKKSIRYFTIFTYLLSTKCYLKNHGSIDKKDSKHFNQCTLVKTIGQYTLSQYNLVNIIWLIQSCEYNLMTIV